MMIAHVTIETQPGRAPDVARRIEALTGLCRLWNDGRQRLTGEWMVSEGHTPEGLSEAIRALDGDIVNVSASSESFAA